MTTSAGKGRARRSLGSDSEEFTSLFDSSSCGRTSTLRMIIGFKAAVEGSVVSFSQWCDRSL